jgi:hypothetical protein
MEEDLKGSRDNVYISCLPIRNLLCFCKCNEQSIYLTSAGMAYLTMTPAMVAALETIDRFELMLGAHSIDSECPLSNPAVGNPIGHSQVISISKLLKDHSDLLTEEPISHHLEHLLRGSRVYTKPPKPKQEPVSPRPMCAY